MKKSILIISILLSIFSISAVGFHPASEILPGQFTTGDFSFDGNVGVGTVSENSIRFKIGGLGNNSSTYSFVLKDKDDSNLMYVRDDGLTYLKSLEVHGITRITPWATTAESLNRVAVIGLADGNDAQLEILSGESATLGGRDSALQAWSNQLGSPRDLLLNPYGGNIGIGTTSPTSKLHVNSSSGITWSDGGESGGLDIRVATSGRDRPYILFQNTAGSTVLYYGNDGTMRIGATTSISQDGTADGGTIVGTQTSDERLKDNIRHVNYGLSEVMQLVPIKYEMNNKTELGFGAQTTLSIIPEAVYDTKEVLENSTRLAMDYSRITPVLVNAIQEQQKLIETQNFQIELLKQDIEELKNFIN